MSEQIQLEDPNIKLEPLDTYVDGFGSTGCVRIETIHGFEIKCEVDDEQIVQEYDYENFEVKTEEVEDGFQEEVFNNSRKPIISVKNINSLMNTSQKKIQSAQTLQTRQVTMPSSSQQSTKNSEIVQKANEILEKLKNSSQIVVKSNKSPKSSASAPQNSAIKTITIKQNTSKVPASNLKAIQDAMIKEKVSQITGTSKVVQSHAKRSLNLANSLRKAKLMMKPKIKGIIIPKSPVYPEVTPKSEDNTRFIVGKSVCCEMTSRNAGKHHYTLGPSGSFVLSKCEHAKCPTIPTAQAKKETVVQVKSSLKNLEILAKKQLNSEILAKKLKVSGPKNDVKDISNENVKFVVKSEVGIRIPPEVQTFEKVIKIPSKNQQTAQKLQSLVSKIKSVPIQSKIPSTSSITNDTNFSVKEEPVETIVNEFKIKQEPIDDKFASSDFIISSIKSEFYGDDIEDQVDEYFDSSLSIKQEDQQDVPSDDIFQYNVVNSFKSDLATRRSVSHTIITEGSNKSPQEIAELARQELMKLEHEKELERKQSEAYNEAVAKAVASSQTVNGSRVVTKVVMPIANNNYQCPICLIKFKTIGQLTAHKRVHDMTKAKLNTAEMTRNVYEEVKMKIEQIGNRKSIHVLLPNYDYAFIVTNSTATKLYMKCFRQTCDVKAYSTNDGKFYLKEGDQHNHGPDTHVIVSKINDAKMSVLEKSNIINKQVHEAIIQKQKQKNLLETKKNLLIERIKKSQNIGKEQDDEKQEIKIKRQRIK